MQSLISQGSGLRVRFVMVFLFLIWYLRQAGEGKKGLDQAADTNKVALRTLPGLFPFSPSLLSYRFQPTNVNPVPANAVTATLNYTNANP
ncbi:hypothetical protein LZ31DRAFT_242908 [Colletotrichum somersetense]|nr:hypothetical protein LZ31DRAFT_242908 [Colletotrichum somersetense]